MPHLDDEQVLALVRLARLDLTTGERDALRHDLERILDYVDRLAAFDDPAAQPLRHPSVGDGVEPTGLRSDLTRTGLPRSALEALAPAWRDDRVEVPRTVEQDG